MKAKGIGVKGLETWDEDHSFIHALKFKEGR